MKKENLEKAIKLRHELHEHPELSNQEIWTKNHLIEFLREHTGLEIVDRGRWFYAVYRSETGNRNIAFRADFDAIAMDEPDTLEYSSKNPAFAIAKVIDAIPELISPERNSWR